MVSPLYPKTKVLTSHMSQCLMLMGRPFCSFQNFKRTREKKITKYKQKPSGNFFFKDGCDDKVFESNFKSLILIHSIMIRRFRKY